MAKAKKAVPDGYNTITPQLTLDDAARAIDWYKKALGAEEISRSTSPDGKIMHAELKIGNSRIMLNDAVMGAGASELRLAKAGPVRVTARVAALLDEKPDDSIRKKPYDQKPYWELERSRLGDTRKVPVELVVNGIAVARQEIVADGVLRPISFDSKIDRSSWIALRILPSSHTNPIFALVGEKPIRPSKASAEWCLRAVDQCWKQKESRIRLEERGEAVRAYEFAREAYRQRIRESE